MANSKIFSRQKRFSNLARSLQLVMIISLGALSSFTIVATGALADGDLSTDDMTKLKAVEEKIFIRTFDDDTGEARLARIEKRMFGESDSGSMHGRLAKIVEIAKPFDKPKAAAPRGDGTKFSAPVKRQQSAEDDRLRQEDAREQARVRAMQAAADEVNQLLGEAVSLYKAQRTNEAMEKFQQVVRLAPDNAQAYFSIGVIYEAQRRYKEAATSYQRAADLDPEKRDYKEAVAIVMKKARNDDDPAKAELKSLASEASAAYSRGEFMSALDLYKQLDQKAPRQALVKYNIGTIYLALKNPVQARESFEDAYKLKPDEPRYKEAFDRLSTNLQHTQQERMDQEKSWEHPGKTQINFVNNTKGSGNNSGGKQPPIATSMGLILKHKGDGVEITAVGIGSRAAQCQLLKGDIIKAIDGAVVESPEQINQIFAAKQNGQFQLLIQRGAKIGQIVF